ncbi:MAG TPA: phytanoyl-CoA dioxygenase family protein [Pyrinomonadaceae bacterium]|jgi:phytanoyl-CoA hydroxylase|nr:phytanoyl-CoA dioxygenase family protein [Pyrinomonadaceae bacterium]
MRITHEQLEDYEREGYLILKDFVAGYSSDRLRARAEELVHDFDPSGIVSIFSTREQNRLSDDYFLNSGDKIRFFFEEDAFLPDRTLKQSKEQSINKIGHALHDLDPVFSEFSRTSDISQLVSDLGIKRPLLLQGMYIFKQPKIGGEVTCHQDSTFLYTEPQQIAGLWFALEDATIENGCLWAIPGGHNLGLKSRWKRNAAGGMSFDVFDSSPWPEEKLVPLQVRKGTLIILNGLLPHKSLANRSTRSRQAYTLHVIGSDCQYPEDNWLQRSGAMPLRGFD